MQAPSHSLSMVPGKVEFADVHFGYQEGHPLLKGISFSVEAGQTLALVGSSGSGKSSIMRLLCRFFDPQQGSVRIDGQVVEFTARVCMMPHARFLSLTDPMARDFDAQSFCAGVQ